MSDSPRAPASVPGGVALFQGIFEHAAVGIAQVGLDGRWLRVNDRLCEIVGYPRDDLLSMTYVHVTHPEDIGADQALARDLLDGRIPWYSLEKRYIRKDGSSAPALLTVALARTPTGMPDYFVSIVEDLGGRKRAEELARRSSETLAQLVRNSPFGVYIVDARFRLVEVSAGSRKVFAGIEPLIGRDFAEILRLVWPEPFATEAVARFRHTLVTGEPYHAPTTMEPRRGGQAVEAYDWQIERIEMPEGGYGVVCHFYDATRLREAERALQESESFHRQALESLPGLVYTDAPDGTRTYLGKQWEVFTGEPAARLLGRGWTAVLHPQDRDRVIEAWQGALAGNGDYQDQYRVRRADGEYLWFQARARAIRDPSGDVVRWFGTALNVDDMVRAEQALQDADQRKDDFIATLAHELRSPLAPLGYALNVLERAADQPELLPRLRPMIARQVAQLVRLIDDLMDVSRIDRGTLELRKERIDLAASLQHALEMARPKLEERRLELALPADPVPVDGDPSRLAQIFTNLLTNAGKFTGPGARIGVILEREGESAVVRVADEGSGIPPAKLEAIFDMFVQLDAQPDKVREGLGIGLWLVRKLASMHGGSVRASSAGIGHGTTMEVRLPIAVDVPAGPSGRRERQRVKVRRILIADDNRDGAESLAMLLRIDDCEVRIAYDGAQALETARDFGPEAVLLDLGMPRMDGFETCRHMRSEPWGARIPIVALTGWGHDAHRLKTGEAGFDAHLVKPVDPDALASTLNRLVERADPEER